MKIMIWFFFFIFEFARQFFAVNWWSVYLHLFEKGCLDSVLIPPPWTNAVLMFICITNPPNSATHETRIFLCCVRAMIIHWSRTKMCLSWTEPNKWKSLSVKEYLVMKYAFRHNFRFYFLLLPLVDCLSGRGLWTWS